MERINKDRILRICSIIIHTQGRSKYRSDFPVIHLFKSNKKNSNYGEYYNHTNTINIWWKDHEDLEEIARTLIHEYTHYLQFWPWYTRYKNNYKYENNPYEVQARQRENIAPGLVELTRSGLWDDTLRKDRKLASIHRKINEMVSIEN